MDLRLDRAEKMWCLIDVSNSVPMPGQTCRVDRRCVFTTHRHT